MAALKILVLFLLIENQEKLVVSQTPEEYFTATISKETERTPADSELTHVRTKNLSGNVKLTTLQVLSTNTPLDKANNVFEIKEDFVTTSAPSNENTEAEVQTVPENQQKILLSEVTTKDPTDGTGSLGLMDVFNNTSGTLPDQTSTENLITDTPLNIEIINGEFAVTTEKNVVENEDVDLGITLKEFDEKLGAADKRAAFMTGTKESFIDASLQSTQTDKQNPETVSMEFTTLGTTNASGEMTGNGMTEVIMEEATETFFGEMETSSTFQPLVTETFSPEDKYQTQRINSVAEDGFTTLADSDPSKFKENTENNTYETKINNDLHETKHLETETVTAAEGITATSTLDFINTSANLDQSREEIENLSSFMNVDEELLSGVTDGGGEIEDLNEVVEDVSSLLNGDGSEKNNFGELTTIFTSENIPEINISPLDFITNEEQIAEKMEYKETTLDFITTEEQISEKMEHKETTTEIMFNLDNVSPDLQTGNLEVDMNTNQPTVMPENDTSTLNFEATNKQDTENKEISTEMVLSLDKVSSVNLEVDMNTNKPTVMPENNASTLDFGATDKQDTEKTELATTQGNKEISTEMVFSLDKVSSENLEIDTKTNMPIVIPENDLSTLNFSRIGKKFSVKSSTSTTPEIKELGAEMMNSLDNVSLDLVTENIEADMKTNQPTNTLENDVFSTAEKQDSENSILSMISEIKEMTTEIMFRLDDVSLQTENIATVMKTNQMLDAPENEVSTQEFSTTEEKNSEKDVLTTPENMEMSAEMVFNLNDVTTGLQKENLEVDMKTSQPTIVPENEVSTLDFSTTEKQDSEKHKLSTLSEIKETTTETMFSLDNVSLQTENVESDMKTNHVMDTLENDVSTLKFSTTEEQNSEKNLLTTPENMAVSEEMMFNLYDTYTTLQTENLELDMKTSQSTIMLENDVSTTEMIFNLDNVSSDLQTENIKADMKSNLILDTPENDVNTTPENTATSAEMVFNLNEVSRGLQTKNLELDMKTSQPTVMPENDVSTLDFNTSEKQDSEKLYLSTTSEIKEMSTEMMLSLDNNSSSLQTENIEADLKINQMTVMPENDVSPQDSSTTEQQYSETSKLFTTRENMEMSTEMISNLNFSTDLQTENLKVDMQNSQPTVTPENNESTLNFRRTEKQDSENPSTVSKVEEISTEMMINLENVTSDVQTESVEVNINTLQPTVTSAMPFDITTENTTINEETITNRPENTTASEVITTINAAEIENMSTSRHASLTKSVLKKQYIIVLGVSTENTIRMFEDTSTEATTTEQAVSEFNEEKVTNNVQFTSEFTTMPTEAQSSEVVFKTTVSDSFEEELNPVAEKEISTISVPKFEENESVITTENDMVTQKLMIENQNNSPNFDTTTVSKQSDDSDKIVVTTTVQTEETSIVYTTGRTNTYNYANNDERLSTIQEDFSDLASTTESPNSEKTEMFQENYTSSTMEITTNFEEITSTNQIDENSSFTASFTAGRTTTISPYEQQMKDNFISWIKNGVSNLFGNALEVVSEQFKNTNEKLKNNKGTSEDDGRTDATTEVNESDELGTTEKKLSDKEEDEFSTSITDDEGDQIVSTTVIPDVEGINKNSDKPGEKKKMSSISDSLINSLHQSSTSKIDTEKPQISANVDGRAITFSVKISDNGTTLSVPSDALLTIKPPNYFNITWRSTMPTMNNSIEILEKSVRLSIVKGTQTYIHKGVLNPETKNKLYADNSITLDGGIQIDFSNTEFLKANLEKESAFRTLPSAPKDARTYTAEITGGCLGVFIITSILIYLIVMKFKGKSRVFKPNGEV